MVHAEDGAQAVGDLSERGHALHGGEDGRDQIGAGAGGVLDGRSARSGGSVAARRAERLQALGAPPVELLVDAQRGGGRARALR